VRGYPSAVAVVTAATLTCPSCGFAEEMAMPRNACVVIHRCRGCDATLLPRPGDCCVYCSYSDEVCPPKQG
jgi:hypothetical protein